MDTGAELIPVVGLIRQSRERDSKLSPDTQRGGIMTFAENRGQYVVAWGAVIFGGLRLVRGFAA